MRAATQEVILVAALQVVSSRAFAAFIPGKMDIMAPLLDIMDHGGWRRTPREEPDKCLDSVWSALSTVPNDMQWPRSAGDPHGYDLDPSPWSAHCAWNGSIMHQMI